MLVSVGVFVLISGAIVPVLNSTQKKSQSESQLRDTLRKRGSASIKSCATSTMQGIPRPIISRSCPCYQLCANARRLEPQLPGAPAPSGTCTTPDRNDVSLKKITTVPALVKWVRTKLRTTTLWRGVANKVAGADPDAITSLPGVMYPTFRSHEQCLCCANRPDSGTYPICSRCKSGSHF